MKIKTSPVLLSVFALLSGPIQAASESKLADAIEAGSFGKVSSIIGEGDINATQVDGMTALHWAVYHDKIDLVVDLIKRGASPTAENRYGITPLYLACVNGNETIVSKLLKAGADSNSSISGNETALMTASRTGKIGAVRALLDAGAEVDARERRDQTAIMWAAAEGHASVVRELLEAGADFTTPLEYSGYTPLFFAVRNGEHEVTHMLLDAGADINAVMSPERFFGKLPMSGTSPLMLAAENGHFDLAIELLDRGADPNDIRTGYSVLHALTWIRKPDIGESASGDPAPRGSGLRNSEQFIRELVARGADVNYRLEKGKGSVKNRDFGATAFFMASDRADVPYMKLLLELGADPHIPNDQGTTAFLAAAGVGSRAPEEEAGNEAECLEATKLIVSLGVDINTVDRNGETAMHGAALKNIPSMVYYLDELGSNINIWNAKNDDGWTPLLIAQGYRPGNFKPSFETVEAIIEVMARHGVDPPSGPKPKHTNYAN